MCTNCEKTLNLIERKTAWERTHTVMTGLKIFINRWDKKKTCLQNGIELKTEIQLKFKIIIYILKLCNVIYITMDIELKQKGFLPTLYWIDLDPAAYPTKIDVCFVNDSSVLITKT